MRRTETPEPIWIKFCTVVDIPEVVTYTNFGDHRLRGFWVAGGQISPSPIDFHRRPYNTLALPCERVMWTALWVNCSTYIDTEHKIMKTVQMLSVIAMHPSKQWNQAKQWNGLHCILKVIIRTNDINMYTANSNKYQLLQMDPRDALTCAHSTPYRVLLCGM